MAEPKVIAPEDALEEGVWGTIHDPIENEAYTVEGQGEDTAKREREAHAELTARWKSSSVEQEKEPAKKSGSKASSSSSGSSS